MAPFPWKLLIGVEQLPQGTLPLNPYSCSLSKERITLDMEGGTAPGISNRWAREGVEAQGRQQGQPPM